MFNIRWKNKLTGESVFAKQLTEDGICYTFNSLKQEDMFTDQVWVAKKFIYMLNNNNKKKTGHMRLILEIF